MSGRTSLQDGSPLGIGVVPAARNHVDHPARNPVENSPQIMPITLQNIVDIEKSKNNIADNITVIPTLTAAKHDIVYLEFSEGDPRNPVNFSLPRKWLITILGCCTTLLSAAAGSSLSSGFPSMTRDINTSAELVSFALSIYCLGFGISPLVTAPLSEESGRRPLFVISSFIFMLMHIMAAAAHNIATVIVARFILGSAGAAGATMVGGLVADIWAPYERGFPMSLFALAAIGGTGLGPVAAGFVEQNPQLEWRWIQWIHAILAGAVFILIYFFLSETRGGVILVQQARKLRKETGDHRYRARNEDEIPSFRKLLLTSCTRPLYFLFTEPIVASFSLWIGLAWGILYSQIESIGLIFRTLYHFDDAQVGLAFMPMCIGALVGFVINFYQERLYSRHVKERGIEARLYVAIAAAVLFPIGCFIYAWTAQPSVHNWVGPMFGVLIFVTALFSIYLAVFSYLADAYSIYASSALAGQSLSRNMMGVIFPLFTNQMYSRLSFRWASTLFGCLAALLAVVPFILFIYGPAIRARSRFASKLAQEEDSETNGGDAQIEL